MTKRILASRTSNGLRLLLPHDLRFEDYREIRATVVESGAAQSVQLDLARLESVPTWLLGFLLHVEEKMATRIGVKVDNPELRQVFDITGTSRFIEPPRSSHALPETTPEGG